MNPDTRLRGITAIFIRDNMFYPVQFKGHKPPHEEAKDHALLNPGTLRVETLGGEILWKATVQ